MALSYMDPPGGTVIIRASYILRNTGLEGGGIINVGGTMTITDSILAHNGGQISGSAIANTDTMTIAHSTLASNEVVNDGTSSWLSTGF